MDHNRRIQDMLQKELSLEDDFPLPGFDDWKAEAQKMLKDAPFDKFFTNVPVEGIPIRAIYNREDVATSAPDGHAVCGRKAADGKWAVCRDVCLGQAEKAGDFPSAKALEGVDVLAVTLPAGKETNFLTNLKDFEQHVDPVHQAGKKVYLSSCNDFALALLALAACRKGTCRVAEGTVLGGLDIDFLTRGALAGAFTHDPETLADALAQVARPLADRATPASVVCVRADLWQEAGASAVQELSIALALGAAYARYLTGRGFELSAIPGLVRFAFGAGPSFFMEVSKFRAFRLAWANVMKAFGAEAGDWTASVHGRTSLWNQSVLDSSVNILRATTEAFSAVVGGCDILSTRQLEGVGELSAEASRRVMRNVQLIMADEVRAAEVADPAAGSYYVEALTDQLAQEAWKGFQEIEKEGGIVRAIASGALVAQVARTRAARQKNADGRRDVLVGVNMFANRDEKLPAEPPAFHGGPCVVPSAPSVAVGSARATLEESLAALEKGEDTAAVLARFLGEARPESFAALERFRLAEGMETLRFRTEAFRQAKGKRPGVHLLKFGTPDQFRGRADFSTEFFSVAGLEILRSAPATQEEEAARAARESGAEVVVICSLDKVYEELLPKLMPLLKAGGNKQCVVLAGYPEAQVPRYTELGVDQFIHIKANCRETLSRTLDFIGA